MNSDLPLVSVCMNAYNVAKYIEEAVGSVLKQTYPNIELVICNDGSTDGTGELLLKFSGYQNVVIVHTENRGPSAAANEAFKNSTGSYIKFFDADDILNPEHIFVQYEKIKNNPDCIVAGISKRFYNDNINTALEEAFSNWEDLAPIDWLIVGDGHGLGMMQCGMFLIPRHFLKLAGLWNESLSLSNDLEFFTRVFLFANKILFTQQAIVYYRSGRLNTMSNDLQKKKLLSAHNALELTTNRLLENENSKRVKQVLAISWCHWIYNFFLDDAELYKSAKRNLMLLGGHADIYFAEKGSKIVKMIGWKNHKRLKFLLKKIQPS